MRAKGKVKKKAIRNNQNIDGQKKIIQCKTSSVCGSKCYLDDEQNVDKNMKI